MHVVGIPSIAFCASYAEPPSAVCDWLDNLLEDISSKSIGKRNKNYLNTMNKESRLLFSFFYRLIKVYLWQQPVRQ